MGGPRVCLPRDQHRLEIKSPVFTVEKESYLVIEKQQVSNGICGQLEPNGFLAVTYQSVLESLWERTREDEMNLASAVLPAGGSVSQEGRQEVEPTAKLQKQKTGLVSSQGRDPLWADEKQEPLPHMHQSPAPRCWERGWEVHLQSEIKSCMNSTYGTPPRPVSSPPETKTKSQTLLRRWGRTLATKSSFHQPPSQGRGLKPWSSPVPGENTAPKWKHALIPLAASPPGPTKLDISVSSQSR